MGYRGTRVQEQGYRGTSLCHKKMAAGKVVQVLGVTGAQGYRGTRVQVQVQGTGIPCCAVRRWQLVQGQSVRVEQIWSVENSLQQLLGASPSARVNPYLDSAPSCRPCSTNSKTSPVEADSYEDICIYDCIWYFWMDGDKHTSWVILGYPWCPWHNTNSPENICIYKCICICICLGIFGWICARVG